MKIDRIQIGNFKKINSVEITLGAVNYLVGGNNAGKSSVLQAIHMAVSCAKLSVERGEAVVPESEVRYSPTSEFTSLGHVGAYENGKLGSRGRVEFFGKTSDDTIASYRIEIYKGRNYGNVGVDRTGVYPSFGQIIVDPKKLFSVYVPGISGIPHREEYKSYASVFQKTAGGDANLVFRNVIRLLKERELLGKVEELMADLVGPFEIKLVHNEAVDTYLRVEVCLDSSKFIPLDLVGTGVLQILQIISYVALFEPIFLLIDEPDSHLHPSRQSLLSRAFNKISKDYGATVIVSTHSRHLLASADAESKIVWMKDGKVESDDCRDLATVLMDLGALDQLDSGGSDCIICTEDKGKRVIEGAVRDLQLSSRVKVISYNGINNAGSAVAIKAMCDLFPKCPKILIHRDRDFLTAQEVEVWGKDYVEKDMKIFSPPFCDVEAYHCSISHVARVYEIDSQTSAEIVKKAFEESLDKLKSKFKDKRREANQKFWRDGGGPATEVLWGNSDDMDFSNIYGKDFEKTLNKKLPEVLNKQRKDLLGVVSVEFRDLLKVALSELDINFELQAI